ncbi:oxygenase MpaB family protein [Sphingomonas xinjiangensis]|uniref:oxygenase MpaB family protein n=1 Tax=Sphingomonas xinjiangensis TaxID=643568 RepID=UPI001C84B60B
MTLYIGGVAAVLLERAEPRVRHGVWDDSSFKCDPGGRLRRTGMAATITVYGARSMFEATAARVNRMHAHVRGTTPEGPWSLDAPPFIWSTGAASLCRVCIRFVEGVGNDSPSYDHGRRVCDAGACELQRQR